MPARVRMCAFALVLSTAPVSAEDAADGARLFAETCAPCHGPTGLDGAVGSIRGMSRSALKRALNGIEEMPEFDLNDAEVDAILAFLSAPSG